MAPEPFTGFSLGTLHFLEELSRHNNQAWFDQHKDRYERDVRGPALAFIAAMQRPLQRFSPHLRAVPRKQGGSLMRVHRDLRFTRDKSPYKTNVGIQFRHERGKDVHAPGIYFHFDTQEVFVAVGIWRPASDALALIREAIAADPKAWRRASRGPSFSHEFVLRGESLKRPPRGYDANHPLLEDLKRKDHVAVSQLDHDDLMDAGLPRTVAERVRKAKNYLAFLCGAVGVDF